MTGLREPVAPRVDPELLVSDPTPPADEELLRRVRMTGADLGGLQVELVDLERCLLTDTSLARSSWRKGTVFDTRFASCDLANAAFDRTEWQRAQIVRSRLTGASFAGCGLNNLAVADSRADLLDARFARLRQVELRDCVLTDSDWTEARLDEVRFVGCDLTRARFDRATMRRVRFEHCVLTDVSGVASLAGATIEPINVVDLSFQLADALGITVEIRDA